MSSRLLRDQHEMEFTHWVRLHGNSQITVPIGTLAQKLGQHKLQDIRRILSATQHIDFSIQSDSS